MALRYKKDFFDKYDKKYGYLAEEDFSLLISKLPSPPVNGKLLDLACGSGVIGEKFQQMFPDVQVIGADICLPLLKWVTFDACQADACKLPFRSNSIDHIIAAAAFHHFEHMEAVVKECSRCLKHNGVFMAYDPNKFHPQRLIMMTDPLRHFFYQTGDKAISPNYFSKILLQAGIENINIHYTTLTGKEESILSAINSKVILLITKLQLHFLLKSLNPWFIITGTKQ